MAEEPVEPTLALEQLQQFFEERKRVLSIAYVSQEAGFGKMYLHSILRRERGLTQKTIVKLLPVIQRYGYEMPDTSSELTLTLEQLQQFFAEREKTLNISPFGEEAGLPEKYLNKVLKEERSLSQKTIEKLLPVLRKYGYQG